MSSALSKDDAMAAKELYNAGHNVNELVTMFGVSRDTMYRALRRYGTTLHPQRGGKGTPRPKTLSQVVIDLYADGDPWDGAGCREPGMDPDMWHPVSYVSWDAQDAQRICRTCPIADRCLTFAIEAMEKEGIWGGTTPQERRRIWTGTP